MDISPLYLLAEAVPKDQYWFRTIFEVLMISVTILTFRNENW
jgi:hypothetical protein